MSRSNASREANAKLAELQKDIDFLQKDYHCQSELARKYKTEGKQGLSEQTARKALAIYKRLKAKENLRMSLDDGLTTHSIANDFASTQKILAGLSSEKKNIVDGIDIAAAKDSNMESRVTDKQVGSIMSKLLGEEVDQEEEQQRVTDFLASLDISSPVGVTTTTTGSTIPTIVKNNNNNNVREEDRLLNLF